MAKLLFLFLLATAVLVSAEEDGYGRRRPVKKVYKPKPKPVYKPKPKPARVYKATPKPTPPPPFVAPGSAYPPKAAPYTCKYKCKPNSAKYMAHVCGLLYSDALKWGEANCAGYYAVRTPKNKASQYQARLCTYWTQRSIMNVVTSCFIEAHLRNEFVMKYGKEGAGIWFCKYKAFVGQVRDCYKSSAKYYPLGSGMNNLERSIAKLYKPNKKAMPPFEFTGSSLAMCAYYNKDQVYRRGRY